MRILQTTAKRPVSALTFLPDGRLVAGGGGSLDLHPPGGGPPLTFWSHKKYRIGRCVLDARRGWLYCTSPDRWLRVIRLDGAEMSWLPGSASEQHVIALALSPDGGRVALSRGDHSTDFGLGPNRVECWLVDEWDGWRLAWAEEGVPPPSAGPWVATSSLAFSPDGARLAAVSRRRSGTSRLAVRDAASGATLAEAGLTSYFPHAQLLFTPDGRLLVVLEEGELGVWSADGLGQHARAHAPARAHFRKMALHPSGRFLATAGGDGAVRLWHPETLREIRSFKWGIGKLFSVAFNEEGTLGAAGGDKGRIALWDVDD